jgi:hypothetical protein
MCLLPVLRAESAQVHRVREPRLCTRLDLDREQSARSSITKSTAWAPSTGRSSGYGSFTMAREFGEAQ